VAIEAYGSEPSAGTGWSVLTNGDAAVLHGEAECQNLDGSDAGLWWEAAYNTFWVRMHADEVTG
jgi:hypothetical protein